MRLMADGEHNSGSHQTPVPNMSTSAERPCLCGTVIVCAPQPTVNVKCRICKTKPNQRSGPSCHQASGRSSAVRTNRGSKEATVPATRMSVQVPVRRTRSAERYDGFRVHERKETTLPRQTSLQTPMTTTSVSVGSSVQPPFYNASVPFLSSPPPAYDVVVGKVGKPPSYEEYLSERMEQLEGRQTRGRAASTSRQPASNQVNHCPCSKCKSRYGAYQGTTSNSNDDVIFSLDATSAMQGVLTDGIALCNVM